MVGVEIDLVVTDSLQALELYEKIFEVERVERIRLWEENRDKHK